MIKTDFKTKRVKVADIIPFENNPRRNEDAVDPVGASMEQFGYKVPIVVTDDNVIITGHTRLKALKKAGVDEVTVIVADDLTDEQARAFRLADNKTAELAGWDFEALDIELFDIDKIDMEQFGFEPPTVDDEPISETGSSFNYHEQYGVIVMCADEGEQERVYNELTENGYSCKVVSV